jgi:hypothetical protein
MSIVRLCAETLPDGSPCTQFAIRNQPWCRNHSFERRRQQNTVSRQIVDGIPHMDLRGVALTLWNTVFELRTRNLPPLHAYTIFDAALERLYELTEDALSHPHRQPSPTNSHAGNGLHPHLVE